MPPATVPKKRKVSFKGARDKGFRAESEVCSILTELGVPSARVIASGAFKGADGDIKVGITLNEDGSFPEKDESKAVMRAECKNRAINNEKPHIWLNTESPFALLGAVSPAPDLPFKDLAQCAATKVLFWRRAKVPTGSVVGKRYNEVFLAIMGIEDFATMTSELIKLRAEVLELRIAIKHAK